MRVGVLIALALWTFASAACTECSSQQDCGDDEVCGLGVCAPPLTVVSSTTVEGIFDVDLEARFLVGTTTIRLHRSDERPGEPCVAFATREIVVDNTAADFAPVAVRFDGLPAPGADFDLVFEMNSTTLTVPFSGPALADDIGGFEVTVDVDRTGEIDVVRTPTTVVSVPASVTAATVEVQPATGTALPVQALIPDGSRNAASVLLVHGQQTLEVRGVVDGSSRRCAVLLEGEGSRSDTEDTLEFLLVAETTDDTAGGARLSTRRLTDTSTSIVNGDISGELASRSVDVVEVPTETGVVDVAVIPVVASSPLNAIVRVSRRGQHVGAFGPIMLQPASGETWVAGAVVVNDDGTTLALPSSAAPLVGLPW